MEGPRAESFAVHDGSLLFVKDESLRAQLVPVTIDELPYHVDSVYLGFNVASISGVVLISSQTNVTVSWPNGTSNGFAANFPPGGPAVSPGGSKIALLLSNNTGALVLDHESSEVSYILSDEVGSQSLVWLSDNELLLRNRVYGLEGDSFEIRGEKSWREVNELRQGFWREGSTLFSIRDGAKVDLPIDGAIQNAIWSNETTLWVLLDEGVTDAEGTFHPGKVHFLGVDFASGRTAVVQTWSGECRSAYEGVYWLSNLAVVGGRVVFSTNACDLLGGGGLSLFKTFAIPLEELSWDLGSESETASWGPVGAGLLLVLTAKYRARINR